MMEREKNGQETSTVFFFLFFFLFFLLRSYHQSVKPVNQGRLFRNGGDDRDVDDGRCRMACVIMDMTMS